MTRQYTEHEITIAICNQTMVVWEFGNSRRLEWCVWAAKSRACVRCGVKPGERCLNLTDIRNKKQNIRFTKWPHDKRIDWELMLTGLHRRGYYRSTIENIVRKRLSSGESVEEGVSEFDGDKESMPDWAK